MVIEFLNASVNFIKLLNVENFLLYSKRHGMNGQIPHTKNLSSFKSEIRHETNKNKPTLHSSEFSF